MKNWKFVLFLFSIFYFLFFVASPVFAQVADNQLANFIENMPLINAPLVRVVFDVIRYLLGFLGVVAVVILIYGGFLWMTARGNEEQVKKAKKTIINGLIGLIIILLSFAIIQFVVGPLLHGGDGGIGGNGGNGGPGWPSGRNYLVITSKYPRLGAVVAKNNKIIVTFNQSLDINSVKLARPDSPTICKDPVSGNEIWTVGIKDSSSNNFLDGSLKVINNALIFIPKSVCDPPLNVLRCDEQNPQDCSLELTPDGCCGCFPVGDIEVVLQGGPNGLKGTRATGNTMGVSSVSWTFTVANYIETNPPSVENNLPQGTNIPRNVGISVVFSKEIDLSTLKVYNNLCTTANPANCNVNNCGGSCRGGDCEGSEFCLNYAVSNPNDATIKILGPDGTDADTDPDPIPGFFERLSTRAFIFRPSQYCPAPAQGCRCLPSNANIHVELTAEIKDVNCNSLDCTNGRCVWNFETSNTVDLDPPNITSNWPEKDAQNIDRLLIYTGQERGVEVVFTDPSNTPMDETSINEDTFVLRPDMMAREISTSDLPSPPTYSTSTYKPYRVLEANARYMPIIFGGGSPRGSCQLEPDSVWGVKDLAGNAMVENYLWNFTTSSQVNAGNPHIDWVSPDTGPHGQCVTIHGFNLGCCLENPCTDDKNAQENKWTGTTCASVSPSNKGKVEFCQNWTTTPDDRNVCQTYTPATEILAWQEINQPETPCIPGFCPLGCDTNTCESGCGSCEVKPDCRVSDAVVFPPVLNCCCPYPLGYSPENEIIVRVPTGAQNRPGTAGQIKVTPAY